MYCRFRCIFIESYIRDIADFDIPFFNISILNIRYINISDLNIYSECINLYNVNRIE